jgi:hypothetical protein
LFIIYVFAAQYPARYIHGRFRLRLALGDIRKVTDWLSKLPQRQASYKSEGRQKIFARPLP